VSFSTDEAKSAAEMRSGRRSGATNRLKAMTPLSVSGTWPGGNSHEISTRKANWMRLENTCACRVERVHHGAEWPPPRWHEVPNS
jgi:hypothetical protein